MANVASILFRIFGDESSDPFEPDFADLPVTYTVAGGVSGFSALLFSIVVPVLLIVFFLATVGRWLFGTFGLHLNVLTAIAFGLTVLTTVLIFRFLRRAMTKRVTINLLRATVVFPHMPFSRPIVTPLSEFSGVSYQRIHRNEKIPVDLFELLHFDSSRRVTLLSRPAASRPGEKAEQLASLLQTEYIEERFKTLEPLSETPDGQRLHNRPIRPSSSKSTTVDEADHRPADLRISNTRARGRVATILTATNGEQFHWLILFFSSLAIGVIVLGATQPSEFFYIIGWVSLILLIFRAIFGRVGIITIEIDADCVTLRRDPLALFNMVFPGLLGHVSIPRHRITHLSILRPVNRKGPQIVFECGDDVVSIGMPVSIKTKKWVCKYLIEELGLSDPS